MKRPVLILLVSFIITLSLAYYFLSLLTKEIIPGAIATDLPGNCEIIQIDRRLQPGYSIILACPMKDMIRLWPLPMQQPWFEDFAPVEGLGGNA